MNAKVIGKRIKEYRKEKNVSQKALAEQLFVSDKTISRWELGNGLPDIELLPKIADVLGISIDKLVGEEDATDEAGNFKAIDEYKAEVKRLEAQLEEQQKKAEQDAIEKNAKIKKIGIIVGALVLLISIISLLLALLIKPKFTLTLIDATLPGGGTIVELAEGERLPTLTANGKTILGFIDESYNFYTQSDFRMPEGDVTLRALIREDMPLFAGSDGDMNGNRVAEHILTPDGIPATTYVFAAGSTAGSSIQSRPVSDSGEMENVNVYAPSLGERFFLISVENRGDTDVKIRYRIENFGDHQGGLDYYTPSVTLAANSTTLIPAYFKNNSSYGVFEGCDHFVILDSDIEEDVELVVFGYIYTAEELGELKIVKSPDKFIYKEGDEIDLSGLVVKAELVKGSTTGSVTIHNYTCDLLGRTWTAGMDVATVSFAGRSVELLINDPFQYKIAFTPATNLESINGTAGADYIRADYVTGLSGLPATGFTILPGATAGMEVEAWINREVDNAKEQGINLRIPTFSGSSRYLELTVTNNGTEEISFCYYAENYGDKGGVDITVGAGETKTVDFCVDPGTSPGCNYVFKLLCDVQTETSLTLQGYFYCREELSGIEIFRNANKASFTVGELFDTEGLVIKALGENYDDVVISNFETSLDGYVFTESDVGIKTVEVKFADFTVTYEVEIKA